VLKKRIRKQMSSSSDIYTLASKIEADVDTLPNISFSTYSIPNFGPEPRLVGNIMTAPEKKMQGPVQGNMGVYVFYVNRFNAAPETNNYARIIQQRQRQFSTRVAGRNGVGQIFQALKDKADIEDNRILYY
jgi:peptidyl-prolyl cis-trans isomerase D